MLKLPLLPPAPWAEWPSPAPGAGGESSAVPTPGVSTTSHARLAAKPWRKQAPAVPLHSYCDRALSPEGLGRAAGGPCPTVPELGQNKLHFVDWRCRIQGLLAPRPAAPRPVESRDKTGPIPRPRGRFRAGLCLHVPVPAHICVYVCVSVRVRVAPCVWRGFWVCTGVSSRRALS